MNAAVPMFHPSNILVDGSLADEITLLAGQLNAGCYRLLELIAEFDSSKDWSGGGTIRSCAHWLNWKCGIALGAAREKVRVAHCLAELPLINEAFASGEVSYSKVRAMTRVATAENEDYLLMIARHGTASHMEKLVGRFAKVQCAADADAEREQEASRKLVYFQGEDGTWFINARLPAEEGSLVVKAIEAVAAPLREQARENVSAETLSNRVENTRVDALISVAEHFLATAGHENEHLRSLKGSERCQVMLHVDIHTLRQHSIPVADELQCCHLDEKPWVSPDTARRLACDASLVTVLEDENGQVLNIGRRSRTVPAHIRRALSMRDETCRVPGCCESRYVDAHHIVHWVDGGETSLDNLVTLCRHHHRQLHRGDFSIRVESAASPSRQPQLVFETPSGSRLAECFPQFSPQVVASAPVALAKIAPQVDANTCVSGWRGERCDYGMAVGGLLARGSGS